MDDTSSSYKYEIVDVLINNPNSDNNKGLPEIRFYISKNKHNWLFKFKKTQAVVSHEDLGCFGTQVSQEYVHKVKA